MRAATPQEIRERAEWHRSKVADLDVQLAGLHGRRLTPVRRRLRHERSEHLKTIKLMGKLYQSFTGERIA